MLYSIQYPIELLTVGSADVEVGNIYDPHQEQSGENTRRQRSIITLHTADRCVITTLRHAEVRGHIYTHTHTHTSPVGEVKKLKGRKPRSYLLTKGWMSFDWDGMWALGGVRKVPEKERESFKRLRNSHDDHTHITAATARVYTAS